MRATSKLANKAYGETYGVELAVNYQPVDWWRLSAAYTFLNLEMHRRRSSNDIAAEADEGKSPHHQVMLRSSLDLPGHVQFDLTGRYVGAQDMRASREKYDGTPSPGSSST